MDFRRISLGAALTLTAAGCALLAPSACAQTSERGITHVQEVPGGITASGDTGANNLLITKAITNSNGEVISDFPSHLVQQYKDRLYTIVAGMLVWVATTAADIRWGEALNDYAQWLPRVRELEGAMSDLKVHVGPAAASAYYFEWVTANPGAATILVASGFMENLVTTSEAAAALVLVWPIVPAAYQYVRSDRSVVITDIEGGTIRGVWPCRPRRDPNPDIIVTTSVVCPLTRDPETGSKPYLWAFGGPGEDSFFDQTESCECLSATVFQGGSGDDFGNGSSASNLMIGDEGHDTMYGREGNDVLIGDSLGTAGTDPSAAAERTDDRLIGGKGNDTGFGGLGNDLIFGGPDDDGREVVLGEFRTTQRVGLEGGPGDDVIVGGPGRDVMHGETGDDTLLAKESQFTTPADDMKDEMVDCGPENGSPAGPQYFTISTSTIQFQSDSLIGCSRQFNYQIDQPGILALDGEDGWPWFQ